MSQENVEVVRRAWETFTRGMDQNDPGVVFDEGLFAPTATLTPVRELPGSRTYVGREGFLQMLQEWAGDFTDWHASSEKIIDAGDDRVLVVVRQSGRGKASGVLVENEFSAVYTVRDGRVVDQKHYLDPAEALEAAGLSEQDAHADS